MAVYDLAEIEALWITNGGNARYAPMAASIAMAESRGNSTQTHRNSDGSVDRGLFQINSVHGALSTTDLTQNIKAAIRLSNNGKNWGPWTTFHNGSYKQFLAQARNVAASVRADVKSAASHGNANAELGIPGLDQAATALTNTFNAGDSVATALEAIARSLNSVTSMLTSGAFWIRLGEGLLGAVLLVVGLRELVKVGS